MSKYVEVMINASVENVEMRKKILFDVQNDDSMFEILYDAAAEKSELVQSWSCGASQGLLCKVNNISRDSFRQLLKYINDEKYTITEDNWLEILHCAMCMRLEDFTEIHIGRLKASMSIHNICARVVQSLQLKNLDFVCLCLNFIRDNEMSVLKDSTIFDIGYCNVIRLLKSNDIFKGNKIPLFEAMVVWIKWQLGRKKTNGELYLPLRDNYFYAYLKAIPFERLSEKDFLACVEAEPHVLNYWKIEDARPVPTLPSTGF